MAGVLGLVGGLPYKTTPTPVREENKGINNLTNFRDAVQLFHRNPKGLTVFELYLYLVGLAPTYHYFRSPIAYPEPFDYVLCVIAAVTWPVIVPNSVVWQLVEKAGLALERVEITGGCHLRVTARRGDGETYRPILSLTPSDPRTRKNELSRFRRFARGAAETGE